MSCSIMYVLVRHGASTVKAHAVDDGLYVVPAVRGSRGILGTEGKLWKVRENGEGEEN